jgi:rifampicin phosphotransferase
VSATPAPDSFWTIEGGYEPLADDARAPVDDHAAPGVYRGTGACGGRVTGRVAILADVSEASRLEQGDVLVTRQTDPGWAPVFFLISGLVIERGGMLSHGAIVAREFGIPCVVGIRDATSRLASVQRVSVDGDRGEVHVLD